MLTNTHQKLYVLIIHFRNQKGSGDQMLPTIVSAIATGSALVAGLLLDVRIILDSFTVTYLFIYFWISSHPGGYSTKLYTGGSLPWSNPLLFYLPVVPEKAPFSYTFKWQMVPLSHTSSERCIPYLPREICSRILCTIVLLFYYLHLLTCSYFSLVSINFNGTTEITLTALSFKYE